MFITDFFKEIKTGNNILIIFIIGFILLYTIYNYLLVCNNKIENMSNISEREINEAIKKYYSSNEFVYNISLKAAQKQGNNLKIDGNLYIDGNITALGEIGNNSFSFTNLNNRINNIKR